MSNIGVRTLFPTRKERHCIESIEEIASRYGKSSDELARDCLILVGHLADQGLLPGRGVFREELLGVAESYAKIEERLNNFLTVTEVLLAETESTIHTVRASYGV